MKKLKAILSLVLALVLTFSAVFAVSALSPAEYLLGDADLNGTVNIRDASLIQKNIALIEEITGIAVKTADADLDTNITIKDATQIQKYVAFLPVDTPVGEPVITDTTPSEPEDITTTPTEIVTQPVTQPEEPEEKMDTNITIYFSNNKKWTAAYAYFYNEAAQKEAASWPGVKMTLDSVNDYGEQIYKADVDVSQYNRVVFSNGGKTQSMNAAISVASSGFYIAADTPKTSLPLGVYAFGENNNGKQTTVKLDYPDGYQKPIIIWTPNGYNPADTSKKYQVIYLLDGQNQFLGTKNGYGGWVTDKIATCLQNNGHDGFILVGIDNSRNRDNELTPDIGDIVPECKPLGNFDNGTGERFANFVADTVVPYIRANYNVSLKPEDNAIIGSSSGGIEAFYIGMEHMDIFGNIGALSPAYVLYDAKTWDTYLSKFDFTDADKLPRIYTFNGAADELERQLLVNAQLMPQWMAAKGYPEDKMTFVYEDTFSHNEYAWRMIMPETIAWLFELQ